MLQLLRYRWRVIVYRMRMGVPTAFETVGLVLAVIGVWQVCYAALSLVPLDSSRGRLASVISVLAILVTMWVRLGHRPQAVFAAAAKDEARADRLSADLAQGMRSQIAYDSVYALYEPLIAKVTERLAPRPMLVPTDRDGQPCLVVIVPASAQDSLKGLVIPDPRPRGPDWRRRTSTFAWQRQQYMQKLRRQSSPTNPYRDDESGSILTLGELVGGEQMRLRVGAATYGQIVRTSDSLVHEFALFGRLCDGPDGSRRRRRPLRLSPKATLAALPWRRQVHEWEPLGTDLLLKPQSRASGIGVSMVVRRMERGRATGYVARRSDEVGTYPAMLHVVPSGMVSSHTATELGTDASLEDVVELTMMSEFLEECFDVEDLSGRAISNAEARVSRELATRGLSGVEPQLTGFAIDLLNLRLEVCGTLDLSLHAEALDELKLCWEYAHFEPLRSVDLTDGQAAFTRSEFVQSGLGCLALASLAERRKTN